ncbi:MAG: PilZ domain-containing protein [Candidatus Omnitrophota bacterium]
MTESSENRRKYVRIYRHFILTYYPVSNPSIQKDVSQINNISQGGMSFSVTVPLPVGERLVVELKTPFLADSVYLQGEVLECREKISELIYEIRLELKDTSTQAKDILAKVEQYALKES